MGLETAAIIGIAAAGAAAIGGTATAISTNHASKRNAAIQRETNAQNYQMMQEQMAYQTGMVEKENMYNSPDAQRKRYQAAGINPYLAMSNIDAGNMTAQSAPSGNPMQSYQVPVNPAGEILSRLAEGGLGAAQSVAQTDAINLDNDAKRIDLQYKTTEKILDVERKRADLASAQMEPELKSKTMEMLTQQIEELKSNLEILNATKSERKAQVRLGVEQQKLQIRAQKLQNEYQEWFNDFSKKRGEKEMQQLKAIIKDTLTHADLNKAGAAAAVADAALKKASEKGIKIDNYQKNRLNWLIREGVRLDNKSKDIHNQFGNAGRDFKGKINSIIDTANDVQKYMDRKLGL